MNSDYGLLKEIDVEIADTPELRQKGLMWRENLGRDKGMLFDFQKPMKLIFWGKNTFKPLDIAFIDDNMKIIKIDKIKPMTTTSIMSPRPCRYALEVPKEFFKQHSIKPGCQCKHDMGRFSIYNPEVQFNLEQ